ncbi:MAG: hypothetical protein ABIL01_28260 [Pseudomonadota bacterium]
MLYVQIFIGVFGKRIKIEPTAFLIHALSSKEKFSIWDGCEGFVWHQKGVAFFLAICFALDRRSMLRM